MSQFDKSTGAHYIKSLVKFLGYSKEQYNALVEQYCGAYTGKFRIAHKNKAFVEFLEKQTNVKAARVEAQDSTMGERCCLARDYAGFNNAELARKVGVSAQMVKVWQTNKVRPRNPAKLAHALNVPLAWLMDGDVQSLPANSLLGVRVGQEHQQWREALLGMTQSVVADLPANVDEDFIRAHLEWAIFYKPQLTQASRKAGGRWQMYKNKLTFSPWVIRERLKRKPPKSWDARVERILQKELQAAQTVTEAWDKLKAQCEALGFQENEYPTKIALFKRAEASRKNAEKYGVDLNSTIAASVEKYA